MLLRNRGMFGRDLVEDFAKEGIALEDVRLIDARDFSRDAPLSPCGRGAGGEGYSLPTLRQLKREFADAFDTGSGHHERVGGNLIAQYDAAGLRCEQPFGL